MQQLEQAMGALHLNVGRPVVLNGLQSASYLNGSEGLLQQWDAVAERWPVFLLTGPDKGKKKSVKAENLSVVVEEEPVPLAINDSSELTVMCRRRASYADAEVMLKQVGKTKGQDSIAMDTWLKLPGFDETFVRFVANHGQQGHLFYKFLNQHQATIEFSCLRWHSEVIRFEVRCACNRGRGGLAVLLRVLGISESEVARRPSRQQGAQEDAVPDYP
jgi:hypothetical protein